jgi:hypothetical protein
MRALFRILLRPLRAKKNTGFRYDSRQGSGSRQGGWSVGLALAGNKSPRVVVM